MKPKCSSCGKTGDEPHYWWWADERGKGGQLLHFSCAVGKQTTLEKVRKGMDKLIEKIKEAEWDR